VRIVPLLVVPLGLGTQAAGGLQGPGGIMTTVGSRPAGGRMRPQAALLSRIALRASGVVREPTRSRVHVPRWLVAVVVAGDTVAVVVALTASQLIFSTSHPLAVLAGPSGAALAWPVLLAALGCYTRAGLTDRDSQRQIGRAAIILVALFAVVSAVLERSVALTTVVVVVPLVFVISMGTRRAVALRLRYLRRAGVAVRRVVAVGAGEAITELVDQLARVTDHPMVVVGACTEGGSLVEDIPVGAEIRLDPVADADPLRGGPAIETVLEVAQRLNADTICVVGASAFSGDRLRALSWAMRDRGIDLFTAPGLVDTSSHRVTFDRAGIVTLLHLRSVPRHGARRLAKAAVDRVAAAFMLIVLALPMTAVGLAIKATSSGPAFYRHTRIGAGGRPFTMVKFRTMVVNADDLRADLLGSNEHDGLMFKIRNDPRVTKIGRILRKSSMDELPQLINVVLGHMSLVGPRPPLPDEVADYGALETRRLHVRPGMTGLWQVSGRSALNWDETLRLDLRYVDNWTFGSDFRLLWRTVGVVIRGTGAY
jgi:exopolysaccharide biosynthesis polyprenyl glycosylphosphotransferase